MRTVLLALLLTWPGMLGWGGESAGASEVPLRVGLSGHMPPMAYKEGKQIVGAEVDLARALGQELGRPIQLVEVPFEDLIDALEQNKIDIIMSSMSVTRARQFRIAFSNPYLRVGQMALVRANEKFRYMVLASSLADRKVGVRKGTTGDLLAQQEFPRAKRKYYESGGDVAKALSNGKIDLFIGDSTLVWYLAGRYEAEGLVPAPVVLSEEGLAWGVRRSDSALLESVNGFLKKLSESGELNRILHRWIPKLQ